jgi:hypothetical protein
MLLPISRAVLLAALAAALLGSHCVGIAVFLVDADVDDDGIVGAGDLAAVDACLGVDTTPPRPRYDPYGCPSRPPLEPCRAADVDLSGHVAAEDRALVEARLGLAVCNGSEALCERRFDQVAYATTHNAMAARFPPYEFSLLITNQCSGVPTQLAEGVRALMLDIHWWQAPEDPAPDLFLCHSSCDYGAQRLVDGLAEVRDFLDGNPGEVVSFLIETNADTEDREAEIRDAFAASGILDYAHEQAAGAAWPTLAEMIAAGRRLVVLTDDPSQAGCGAEPCLWYHYLWSELAFETPFSVAQAGQFTCDDLRGEPGNDLFILNHFLTQNVGAPYLAQRVNHDPLLTSRIRRCWDFQGRIPNFVTVDFYEIGDVRRAVNLFNYLWGQTGGAAP